MPENPAADTTDPRRAIAPVLGRTPSGVFILTAADAHGRETGMLVSWVQQASFEPPLVSVALNRQRYLHEWLSESPRMAISIVGEAQTGLLKHFVRGFEPDQPAFEGIATRRGVTGLPVLTDSLGWLEGRIVGRTEAGDHIIYLMQVEGAGTGDLIDVKQPMVHVRKSGFNY